MQIIECVPNFSEGRRPEICQKIIGAIKAHEPGVKLLDLQIDPDHNRSVVTFVGDAKSVQSAVLSATQIAIQEIDLNYHRGQHPRIGAVDVIPFVPIKGVSMQECIELAREVGAEIARRFEIPVYLYEEAATRPDRRNLANIRKGEFEGLREEIQRDLQRYPDFGTPRLHPTAGATVVGARMPLIAYNVNLDTDDVKMAKRIAKKVRESSGGLPSVKALGMMLAEKNLAQVSMNLTNYTVTSMHDVYKAIEREAKGYGINIHSSQIVGLLPRSAIKEEWIKELKLDGFRQDQIIEIALGID